MTVSALALVLVLLALSSFFFGRRQALARVGGEIRHLHSLPGHYGWYVALWCVIPGMLVLALWLIFESTILNSLTLARMSDAVAGIPEGEVSLFLNDVHIVANGDITAGQQNSAVVEAAAYYRDLRAQGRIYSAITAIALALIGAAGAWRMVRPDLAARRHVEKIVNILLLICSVTAILATIGIVLSLLFETIRFLNVVPLSEFLFGTHWSPQTALRADQVAASGAFGVIPLLVGTLLITAIAMAVSLPIGLMSAIYMTFYAKRRFRQAAKPLLEILAGIPTVVYGFFAALIVAPFIRNMGTSAGLDVASESALAAGLVMGLMIIPFISSLSDDAITAVPESLSDGSYALGATRSETIRKVILPAALPGIMGAFLLAVSRAIGETMIVVMAAGLAANLTVNPLEAVTTITVQIVTLLTGDQEFDSAKTLSAFALGFLLFIITLGLNVLALMIVRKYREEYD